MCVCELIPVEIWALIGTFSDAADFLALACTSSVMNRVLDDDVREQRPRSGTGSAPPLTCKQYAWLGITTLSSEPLDLDVVNKERWYEPMSLLCAFDAHVRGFPAVVLQRMHAKRLVLL